MTERLAEWSRLIDGLEADGAVPTAILDSWQRSRDAGVERDEPKFHRVPDEELRARLASNAAWLAIAEPHLEWLTKAFKHIPHVVYVTDRDGIVLSSAGSDSLIARFALFPGYDWSEATMGTNGAGTALVANQPVAVVGPQHLVRQFDDCTCTGAPIHAPDGTLLGALDISTSVADAGPERLFVVAHAAYAIGRGIALRESEARYEEAEALRVMARDKEREATALLDAIFNAAPVRVNPLLAEINGLSPDAHLGKRPNELLPGIAGLDEILAQWRRVVETGEPLLDVEVRGRTRAPAERERVWKEHFFPVRVGDDIVGLAAVIDEITERCHAEEALRESEKRYRTLFESIDEGFCVLERVEGRAGEPLDFRYVEANPAFVVQSGIADVVGRTIRQVTRTSSKRGSMSSSACSGAARLSGSSARSWLRAGCWSSTRSGWRTRRSAGLPSSSRT
jgi:PAS domain-containing protein